MEIVAPTFNSLNKAQRRALILRDQLRYHEPRHLDRFIDGISEDEPPSYQSVNGKVHPPLKLVTIKTSAKRFELGNVLFPESNNTVLRTHLEIDDNKIEMRTEQALPRNDDILETIAIYSFIAKTMVPMFKDKYRAILARVNKINDARKAAYKKPMRAPTPLRDGEVRK